MLRSISTNFKQILHVNLFSIKKYDLITNDMIEHHNANKYNKYNKYNKKNLLINIRNFNFSTGNRIAINIYTSKKRYICILNNNAFYNLFGIIAMLLIILNILLMLYIIGIHIISYAKWKYLYGIYYKGSGVYSYKMNIIFSESIDETNIDRLIDLINEMNADRWRVVHDIGYGDDIDLCINTLLHNDKIYLHIMCEGGTLNDAYRAAKVIENSTIPVHTIGYKVMSAATFLFLSGEKRLAINNDNKIFLIHEPKTNISCKDNNVSFSVDELKDMCENLQKEREKMIITYNSCTNDNTDYSTLIKNETFLNNDEALQIGFIDEIYKLSY